MDSKTKEILIGLLDWHEDNARELENETDEQEAFRFHYEATVALSRVVDLLGAR